MSTPLTHLDESPGERQPFPCTRCGLCCQMVSAIAETWFLDRGDGTCRHYDETGRTCTIYATRPDICRVDRQYALHYVRFCSWDEFVTLNLQVCRQLDAGQRED